MRLAKCTCLVRQAIGSKFPAPLAGVTNVGRLSPSNSEYCFLSKFDTTGSNLLYSVIYLDTAEILGQAHCDAMTVNAAGTAYTLYQSIDGAFVKMLRTVSDAGGTIASGTMLLTYLEGFLPAPAIKVDANGYIYAIGGCFNRRSQSPNPYPLPNGFRANPNSGKCISPDNFFSIGPSESILAQRRRGRPSRVWHIPRPAHSTMRLRPERWISMRFGIAHVGGHTISSRHPTQRRRCFSLLARTTPCDDGFLVEN